MVDSSDVLRGATCHGFLGAENLHNFPSWNIKRYPSVNNKGPASGGTSSRDPLAPSLNSKYAIGRQYSLKKRNHENRN